METFRSLLERVVLLTDESLIMTEHNPRESGSTVIGMPASLRGQCSA